MPNFGLCHIKAEGKAMHPDDIYGDMTDGFYLRQLRSYRDEVAGDGIYKESCVRDNLLKQLKDEE